MDVIPMFCVVSNEWKNRTNFQSLIFRSASFCDCFDFIIRNFPNARYDEDTNCWIEISRKRWDGSRFYSIVRIKKEDD